MRNADIIRPFADNPLLVEAVKEAILDFFRLETVDTTGPNEQVGERVRARLEGAALVEAAFREIERHRTVKAPEKKPNPGR